MSFSEWYSKRRRRAQEIIVPSAFPILEELKSAEVYKEKDRQTWRRITLRLGHGVKYVRTVKNGDGTVEEEGEDSLGDEIMRNFLAESVLTGGFLGEVAPVDFKSYGALTKLRQALESTQQEYGKKNPLVQAITRLTRGGSDRILPRTVTRSEVDTERVVVKPSGMEGLFPQGMNVNLEGGVANKEELEKLKEIERMRDKMLKGEQKEK